MSEVKVKPIVLKDAENGDEFILEFNRESIKFAESKGFDISDIENAPMTRLEELFYYSFRMHNRFVNKEKAMKILYEDLGGLTTAMIERLAELYAVPVNSLMRDDEEAPKNAKMTIEM